MIVYSYGQINFPMKGRSSDSLCTEHSILDRRSINIQMPIHLIEEQVASGHASKN